MEQQEIREYAARMMNGGHQFQKMIQDLDSRMAQATFQKDPVLRLALQFERDFLLLHLFQTYGIGYSAGTFSVPMSGDRERWLDSLRAVLEQDKASIIKASGF